MSRVRSASPRLTVHPVDPQRWSDMEKLFGERGACGGCWCMWWHLKRAEFERRKGEANRRDMKQRIDSGDVPGLIGYLKGEPVAWCSIAPREYFSGLQRSRILKPVDEQPVWSVVCFFVARPFRRLGVAVKMLEAAVAYAKRNGARIVEGYPVEPRKDSMPDAFAWIGLASLFEKAGFEEVARRSATRPIMRRFTSKGRRS